MLHLCFYDSFGWIERDSFIFGLCFVVTVEMALFLFGSIAIEVLFTIHCYSQTKKHINLIPYVNNVLKW